jgi:cellulose synthase/poly-beta-1,6-N-acetylglucosamine synthase-like glycosyltransferase
LFLGLPLAFLVLVLLSDSALRFLLVLARGAAPPPQELLEEDARAVAVVIPAHNEASAIGATVERLQAQTPPGGLFVIADNCTDDTADVARKAGAQVWERAQSADQGKGAALQWFLAAAAQELRAYNVIAIFDADSIVEASFLRYTLPVLASGVDAVQGYVQPLSNGGTASALAAYSEILAHQIDDLGRLRLGWPPPLRGTGMVVRREALEALAPRLRTRVEDAELSLLLAVEGKVVQFVPHSAVGDPKPATARGVATQRGRWLQGQAEMWRWYWRGILRLALSGGPRMWSLMCALLLKPKALVFSLKVLLLVLSLAMPFPLPWLRNVVVLLLSGAVLVDFAYYIIGLAYVDTPWFYARALLSAPMYVLMWLRGMLIALTSREQWLETED